ncbi:hypothetical protein [Streptomyces sp. NBC_00454]|uniref:hypothetical protein n=1 Tax=Streptomyces sp. NBC_00454 TaxID=2975747 RepID=UPI0030E3502C
MGSDGSGLFSLVWGLGATSAGLVLVTNFRGAAEWLVYMQDRRARISSRMRLGVTGTRCLGGVFAVVGLPVLITGVIDAAEHGLDGKTLPRLPLPFAAFMCLIAVLGLWSLWRPAGPLRPMWTNGFGLRRTALAIQTAAVPAFVFFLWSGNSVAMHATWLTGMAATLTALASGPSRRAPAAP